MAISRVERQRAKTVLWHLMKRIGKTARNLSLMGRNRNDAIRVLEKRYRFIEDAARWRRWYKANKKYHAQMRALRRGGCRIGNMPTDLPTIAVL